MRSFRNTEWNNAIQKHMEYVCGSPDTLGTFLIGEDGECSSFLISGGTNPEDRVAPLFHALDSLMGYVPLVIIHNSDDAIEYSIQEIWTEKQNTDPQFSQLPPPLIMNRFAPEYEPFFGMDEMEISFAVKNLALELQLTPAANLERVIRGHAAILRQLNVAVSLTGFQYLCGFQDMGEFHSNVLNLPCGVDTAERIWADLDTNRGTGSGQFELFRSVINSLAYEASRNCWSNDGFCRETNCLETLRGGGVLSLEIDPMCSNLFLTYLAEECRAGSGLHPFIIVDGIPLNQAFTDYLQRMDGKFGLMGENVPGLFDGFGREPSSAQNFEKLSEKIQTCILFKHNTRKVAEVFSKMIGNYDYLRLEEAWGSNRNLFSVLPQNYQLGIRETVENRFRVMPEDITSLNTGQAIVFDTRYNSIIRFN